jgi:hypothetical protein
MHIFAMKSKLHLLMELVQYGMLDICDISWTTINKVIAKSAELIKNVPLMSERLFGKMAPKFASE